LLTPADNWRINSTLLRARIKDLPSGVGVTKTTSGRGREFWRVRLGKRFTGGPVVKKDFSNLAEARAWIFGGAQSERANPGHVLHLKSKAGLSAFELSPAEIAEAAAAMKSCKEAGISLSEAVRFAIKHSRPPGGSKSLQEAIDALIKTKAEAGRSARHLRGLRWNLQRFADAQGKEKSVHEVQRHDVESWLNAQLFSLKTRANYLRDLGILFNFAISRRWMAENPCAFIEKPSELDREISALTPKEASKLLAACPDAFLPGVCMKLFAGLRTSELLSLDWSEVSASEIVIRGAKAKTRQRRIVAISENLAAWLQPCRQPSGQVAPFLQNRWHRSLETIAESTGLMLPPNVLRHSFGSYHFAQHRNENLTAAEMGNSPAMIFQHYRAVVTPEAAARFWSLSPTLISKVINLAA
jgi:site-specific recombinase XerD